MANISLPCCPWSGYLLDYSNIHTSILCLHYLRRVTWVIILGFIEGSCRACLVDNGPGLTALSWGKLRVKSHEPERTAKYGFFTSQRQAQMAIHRTSRLAVICVHCPPYSAIVATTTAIEFQNRSSTMLTHSVVTSPRAPPSFIWSTCLIHCSYIHIYTGMSPVVMYSFQTACCTTLQFRVQP